MADKCVLDVFILIFHPTSYFAPKNSNFEYFFERQNTHIERLFRFLISKSSVYSFNKMMDSSDSDSTGSKQKSPVKKRAFKKPSSFLSSPLFFLEEAFHLLNQLTLLEQARVHCLKRQY